MEQNERYTVFAGFSRIAGGSMEEVAAIAKRRFDGDATENVLVFDNESGRTVDFDLSGSVADVVEQARSRAERRPSRGRPKLGVDCGELCLLPRHWEWLAAQPRSASATVRRLIDAARKAETPEDRLRDRIDAAGAFMWSIAGDLPGFEEASRALYATNWAELERRIESWPEDVRAHALSLLEHRRH